MKIEKKHIILAGVVTGGLVALYYGIKFFKNMQVEKALEDDVNTSTTQPSNKTATGTKVVPTSGGSSTVVSTILKTDDPLYASKDIDVKNAHGLVFKFKKNEFVGFFKSSSTSYGSNFYRLEVFDPIKKINTKTIASVLDNWVYTK